MQTIVQWLASTGPIQSLLLKMLRHLLTILGGALAAWMLSKGFSADTVTQVVGDLASLILIGVGAGLSALDYKAVGLKIEQAGVQAAQQGGGFTTAQSAPIAGAVSSSPLPPPPVGSSHMTS